jgi:hypothetical protein
MTSNNKKDFIIVKLINTGDSFKAIDRQGTEYNVKYNCQLRHERFNYYQVPKETIEDNTIIALFMAELEVIDGKLKPSAMETEDDFIYYDYLNKKMDLHYKSKAKVRDQRIKMSSHGKAKYFNC